MALRSSTHCGVCGTIDILTVPLAHHKVDKNTVTGMIRPLDEMSKIILDRRRWSVNEMMGYIMYRFVALWAPGGERAQWECGLRQRLPRIRFRTR